MEQTDREGVPRPWSVAGDSAVIPVPNPNLSSNEKALPSQPDKRVSDNSIPEIISSPALSLKLPSPPKPAARLSAGESSPVDYVPLVQRRLSPGNPPTNRLSALKPLSVEALRSQAVASGSGSNSAGRRETSPRRNSQGEPLSPGAWMAGFGLAPGANSDPFTNPAYVSSSDHHSSFGSQTLSKVSEPGSPLSNAPSSSASDRTPRGGQTSPQRYNRDRDQLSAIVEPGDVTGDGASDIISTFGSAFGDRPASHHTASSMDEHSHYASNQPVRYHPLSDVEVCALHPH